MSRMLRRLRIRLKAHFSRYEGIAKEVYEDALETPEATIRDIYKIMSENKFIYPNSDKVAFNSHMANAVLGSPRNN